MEQIQCLDFYRQHKIRGLFFNIPSNRMLTLSGETLVNENEVLITARWQVLIPGVARVT